jgi:OFA family oxalate/formate antiporter-like MFS transporter
VESRDKKGWLSVLGCAIGIFWSGTIAFGYPGVMRAYWQEHYGVGAGVVGLVVSFMLLALGVFMFFTGKWHLKIGTRISTLIGTAFTLLAMVILNNAPNIYVVYVWAFVVNIGCSFIYGPGLATVQQWFPNRRGLVSGLINLVFGMSAAVMSPILNLMMDAFGYITTNYIIAAAILVTNLISVALAEVPSRAKLTEEEKAAHQRILAAIAEKAKKPGAQVVGSDMTVGEALRSRAFWFIWFTWVFLGAAGISMVTLSTSYAVSLGLIGITVLTSFNLTNGVSRIIAGTLSDVIGPQKTGSMAFVIAALGYFALPHTNSLVIIAIFAAMVGFGFGTLFAITPPLASGIFGLKYFGMIFGLIFTAYGFIAGIAGPALAGFVLDFTGGSYTAVFTYLAIFCLLAAVLVMMAKPATARGGASATSGQVVEQAIKQVIEGTN